MLYIALSWPFTFAIAWAFVVIAAVFPFMVAVMAFICVAMSAGNSKPSGSDC
jgi:uncharacterized membrane protein